MQILAGLCIAFCVFVVYACLRVGAKADTEANRPLSDEVFELAYDEQMVKFKNDVEDDLRRLDVREKAR